LPGGPNYMPAMRFVEQLNVQIGHEFAAHQQYVACAVYYQALTMPQMARFFYAQALEEREHAMMMIKYLIDQDAPVIVPGVSAPQTDFSDVVAPVELALDQERRVSALINELTKIARDEGDFASDQFMQWFIKEQVEEVATMSDLVAVARRARDNIEAIEEYVQREQRRESADPTATAIAGG
jgi:bacterioferritin B